jgi:hypothetical protein
MMGELGERREWSYLSNALREFNIPKSRLMQAIADGKVKTKQVNNPHYSKMTATLVSRADIKDNLGSLQRSSEEQTKLEKRSIVGRRVAEKKRDDLLDWVERLQVKVRRYETKEALTEAACRHYNELWAERDDGRGRYDDKHASPSDDVEFLNRITMNFLRHDCSGYERYLDSVAGKTGAPEARALLREKINKKILEQYPFLHSVPPKAPFQ